MWQLRVREFLTTAASLGFCGPFAGLVGYLERTVWLTVARLVLESENPFFLHFLLLVAALLMSGAAVLAPASVSNPSTAENFFPID